MRSLARYHSVKQTPTKGHDITVAHAQLRGDEQTAFADAGHHGIEKPREVGSVIQF